MLSGARTAFGDRQVRGVAFDGEQHVTGGETDRGVGMSGTIVEQLCQFVHCGGGGVGLFGRQLTNGGKKSGVDGAGVEEKSAEDLKNPKFVGGIDGWGGIGEGGKLGFGAVVWSLPRMRRVFRFWGRQMLKALECAFNISRHGNVARAVGVIPVETEATVTCATSIKTDLIGAFERRDKMLGVGNVGRTNAEVIDHQAEDNVASLVFPQSRR